MKEINLFEPYLENMEWWLDCSWRVYGPWMHIGAGKKIDISVVLEVENYLEI